MTGYGKAVLEREGIHWVAELSAVNRKHLDINILLPRHFLRFDARLRKVLSGLIFRGHITLRVSASMREKGPLNVVPNIGLAKQLFTGWKKIAEALGSQESLSLSLLEAEPELFLIDDHPLEMEKAGAALVDVVQEALRQFDEMRCKEGIALHHEISQRLDLIAHTFKELESRSAGSVEQYRSKLLERIRGMLPEIAADDARVLKEIALFAEKIDITEEIVRFKSHIQQFKDLLTSNESAVQKKAEFILQEMAREINTTGSKTNEIEVTNRVIAIKAELEKIREQIQNVE